MNNLPTMDMIALWLKRPTDEALAELERHRACKQTVFAAMHLEKIGKGRKRLREKLLEWMKEAA